MKDLFVLKNSDEINVTDQANYPASLELIEAGDMPYQLSGTVKNTVGDAPIANAYVAVYTTAGVFVAGNYTDDYGEYAVPLAANIDYEAIASATGYAPSATFTLNIQDQSITHPFTLTAYSEEDRVIYGKIYEIGGTVSVEGARIDVIDSLGEVVATTISIPDGEYSVPNLPLGEFSLVVSKAGYNTERENVEIIAGTTLVEVNVELTPHTEPTGSTISGYITETDDTGIANAWVGLYLLPNEALQETTSTNADGYYCFENVPEGDYVVKSKAVEQ